jgi:hypothetical protein
VTADDEKSEMGKEMIDSGQGTPADKGDRAAEAPL